jgi:hypothetical protein
MMARAADVGNTRMASVLGTLLLSRTARHGPRRGSAASGASLGPAWRLELRLGLGAAPALLVAWYVGEAGRRPALRGG